MGGGRGWQWKGKGRIADAAVEVASMFDVLANSEKNRGISIAWFVRAQDKGHCAEK